MPGMRCAVVDCNNSYVEAKKRKVPMSFHSFPNAKELRDNWKNACKRGDSWNPATSYICGAHFKDEDFENDLQSRLMNVPVKRKLKKTAVPTIFSTRQECKSKTQDADNIQYQEPAAKFDNKKYVEELLLQSENVLVELEEEETFEEKYKKLLKENEMLKQKFQESKNTIKFQKNQINKLIKNEADALKDLKIEQRNSKRLESLLQGVFSKAQIDFLSKKKKKVHWSSDDVSKAFALRYLSKSSYVYIRNKLNYPLPHIKTLQKWASKLKFQKGPLTGALQSRKIQTPGIIQQKRNVEENKKKSEEDEYFNAKVMTITGVNVEVPQEKTNILSASNANSFGSESNSSNSSNSTRESET